MAERHTTPHGDVRAIPNPPTTDVSGNMVAPGPDERGQFLGTLLVPRSLFLADRAPGPDAYALQVTDDRMAPLAGNGDYVILSPSAMPRTGDLVAAYLINGQITLKRLKVAPLDRLTRLHAVLAIVPAARSTFAGGRPQ